jgi:hypothetical protein
VSTEAGELQAVHGGPLRVWTNKELAIVARQVCKKCNNGWMSDLESRAKPVLTPLVQGASGYLDASDQATIAAWGAKTALALHLTTPEKVAPVEHYREIASTGLPPKQTLVWLAAHDARAIDAYHRSHVLSFDGATMRVAGYATTIAISRVVIQVVGYVATDRLEVVKGGRWRGATIRIRPPSGIVSWPPRDVFDQAALAAFADSVITAGDHAVEVA